MGAKSNIQWTDLTWNIAVGCTKVDADCKYCYMYRQSLGGTRYEPKKVVRTKTVFNLPLKYKGTVSEVWPGRPLVFTSSLTDFFHPDIDEFRDEAWDIIRRCPHLIFQILTKRPERIMDHLPADWGDGWENVWLGTSIGSMAGMDRLYPLLNVPARCRFVSFEPMYERIDLGPGDKMLFLSKIDWAIIGGESGNDSGQYRYRPCETEWIEELATDLAESGVQVFIKQMGTHLAKKLGYKDRHGGDINEWPYHLQVRNFPNQ